MELPIRLVVYVILTAAIVAVAAIGLQYLKSPMTTNIMEKQLGEIKISLNTMQYGAARNLIDPASPNGNTRTFKITIPEDVEYLAFGVDPDPDNDDNLTNTKEGLLTDRGNVIFYKSRTGGKVRVPLDDSVEIREGLLENGRWVVNKNANGMQYGAVIRGAGKYEITFELVYDPISRQKFTLSHFTDDLNAYINPYDPTILPNRVEISVDPNSIPADGATIANVVVRLKDKKGRDASKDGVPITLTTSLGSLVSTELTTVKGRSSTEITSYLVGTAMITASSPGLNSGSTSLTITQAPINIQFADWIYGTEVITREFTTKEELTYHVTFKGYGKSVSVLTWKFWPIASIEIDDKPVGEESIESDTSTIKEFPNQITLSPGSHTITVKMANNNILLTLEEWLKVLLEPLLGNIDLYVENISLSE